LSKPCPGKRFLFIEPRIAVHAVFGEAGPFGESADGVTVRVGVPYGHDMAEEDLEGRGCIRINDEG
jgi:hypothetical protein